MSIYLGSEELDPKTIGGDDIEAIYIGADQVWTSAPTPYPTGFSYSKVTSDQNMAGKTYGIMCNDANDVWFSSGGSFNNSTYDISAFGSSYQSNTFYLKVFVFEHGTANLAMQPWCVATSNLPGNAGQFGDLYYFMGNYDSSAESNYMATYYNGNRDLFVADLFSYRQ